MMPRAIRSPQSVVRGPWSMVCGPWSVVCGPWSVVQIHQTHAIVFIPTHHCSSYT